MQHLLDHCLGPKCPSDSEDPYSDIKNLAQCRSCPRDHSVYSTNRLSVAGTIAVLSIHVTILENLASKSLTAMGNRLIDSVITFHKNIWKLADRNTLTLPACSYRSQILRILLKDSST